MRNSRISFTISLTTFFVNFRQFYPCYKIHRIRWLYRFAPKYISSSFFSVCNVLEYIWSNVHTEQMTYQADSLAFNECSTPISFVVHSAMPFIIITSKCWRHMMCDVVVCQRISSCQLCIPYMNHIHINFSIIWLTSKFNKIVCIN